MSNNEILVLDLQRVCIDESESIADILRMAKMVAVYLENSEDTSWIDCEINGYDLNDESLPNYRRIKGKVRGVGPYNRLVPLFKGSKSIIDEEQINSVNMTCSIEDLIDFKECDDHRIFLFEKQLGSELRRMQGGYWPMEPCKVVNNRQIVEILDSIKNRVLDWALELETRTEAI